MSFRPDVDLATLEWVAEEVRSTMKDALRELQGYKITGDNVALHNTANFLHQIGGTLQMVQLDAVGRFVQELEQVATEKELEIDQAKLSDVLSEGIKEIGLALDRVTIGRPELPAYRLAVINNLRELRGEPEFYGSEFFLPVLDALPELPAGEALSEEDYIAAIKNQRLTFQKSLLAWLKGGDIQVLTPALSVAEFVLSISRFSYATRMWWVACAYLEILIASEGVVEHQHRIILRRLDDLLRELGQHGESAMLRDPEIDLLKSMLFEIGRVEPKTSLANKVSSFYLLEQFFNEPVDSAGSEDQLYDRETLIELEKSVVVEVASIQQLMTRYFDGDGIEGELLDSLLPMIQKLSDSAKALKVKPLSELSKSVGMVLARVREGKLDSSETLALHLAAALLFLEQALSGRVVPDEEWEKRAAAKTSQFKGLVDGRELGHVGKDEVSALERVQLLDVVSQAVDQTLSELERDLESFSKDPVSLNILSDIASKFDHVRGVLQILGEQRASLLLTRAADSARAIFARKLAPTTPVLEALAVVVGAIDAYVGALKSGRGGLDELIERSLGDLERASGKEVSQDDVEELIERSTHNLQRWLHEPAVLESLTALRGDLRDMHALSATCGLTRATNLGTEVQGLLDVVESDPGLLAPEVVAMLKASMAKVAEQIIELYVQRVDLASSEQQPASSEIRIHDDLDEGEINLNFDLNTTDDESSFISTEDELRAVFVEEMNEVLPSANKYLLQVVQTPSKAEALEHFRRLMHTIKGSGRTAGLQATGELGWIAESLCNIVLDAAQAPSSELLKFLAAISKQLGQLHNTNYIEESNVDLVDWHRQADDLHEILLAGDKGESGQSIAARGDEELRQVFAREASKHVNEIEQWMATDDRSVSQKLRLAIHTLLGNFRTLGLTSIGKLFSDVDDYIAYHYDSKVALPVVGVEALKVLLGDLRQMVNEVSGKSAIQALALSREAEHQRAYSALIQSLPVAETAADPAASDVGKTLAELAGLVEAESVEAKTSLDSPQPSSGSDIFIEEAQGLLDFLASIMTASGWPAQMRSRTKALGVWQSLKTLANASGELVVARLSLVSENFLRDEDVDFADSAVGQLLSEGPQVLKQLITHDLDDSEGVAERYCVRMENRDLSVATAKAGIDGLDQHLDAKVTADAGHIDPELVSVFCDEAHIVLRTINEQLSDIHDVDRWQIVRDSLLRALHTLKGSARMAGFDEVGELVHLSEGFVESREELSAASAQTFRNLLEETHDVLVDSVKRIESGQRLEPFDSLRGALSEAAALNDLKLGEFELHPDLSSTSNLSIDIDSELGTDVADIALGKGGVNIDYIVLDKLSDVISSSSVSRAQIEEDVVRLRETLEQQQKKLISLTDQLDDFNVEVETQIDAGVENTGTNAGKLDPLEMDRYSRLQQATRSMLEEIDDLKGLEAELNSRAGRIEDSLARQGSAQAELQQEVMAIRLVPFADLAPQLRQVVRQTSRQLGKRVAFEITGQEIGIDRAVLDIIGPALEHLLRNAVDHGIESTNKRKAASKPIEASIKVHCEHIGRDVRIAISDDGAGLNFEEIAQRAVEAELVESVEMVTPQNVIQFITSSGFSTASEVTAVSGRGVGLDAVKHALHVLGGSIDLEPVSSGGTTFVLRVPVSLAVSRVLFFRLGKRDYAAAAHTIERVKQLSAQDYKRLRSGERFSIDHDGEPFLLIDLLDYFGGRRKGKDHDSLPVLMVRCGTQNIAVVVDQIGESREVMLRPFGGHLEQLTLFSGTTPGNDGELALVVNFVGLSYIESEVHVDATVSADGNAPVVLVVDDSLTVRKAAERDLAAMGIEAVMARDGVEAQRQIADRRPALILLDLEMPRLDGFGFLEWKANQAEYMDIPVAIISSRTLEHYRQRAFDLGASDFLCKPYDIGDLRAVLQARIPKQLSGDVE